MSILDRETKLIAIYKYLHTIYLPNMYNICSCYILCMFVPLHPAVYPVICWFRNASILGLLSLLLFFLLPFPPHPFHTHPTPSPFSVCVLFLLSCSHRSLPAAPPLTHITVHSHTLRRREGRRGKGRGRGGGGGGGGEREREGESVSLSVAPTQAHHTHAHSRTVHTHADTHRIHHETLSLSFVVQLSFFVFVLSLALCGKSFASTPNSKRRHLAKHLTNYHHHHHHLQQQHHHHSQQALHHQHQHHPHLPQQQKQQQQSHHQQQQQQRRQPHSKRQQQRSAPPAPPAYATATATSATSYASTAQLTRYSGKGSARNASSAIAGAGGGAGSALGGALGGYHMRLFGDSGYGYGSIGSSTRCEPPPSLWYSVLALPFDDQKLARRELSTYGRGYRARAGLFSSSSHMWKRDEDGERERKNTREIQ